MIERKSEVFVVVTANDIQALPPELIQKGGMDEIFFIDLSDGGHAKQSSWSVIATMYTAKSIDSSVDQALSLEELSKTRLLSVAMSEKINALKQCTQAMD